jgi:ATP-binding cassette subfamily C protein LapB
MNMLYALLRIVQLQRESVSGLALREAVHAAEENSATPESHLLSITKSLHAPRPVWLSNASPSDMPALLCSENGRWGVLIGVNAQMQWVVEWFAPDGKRQEETVAPTGSGFRVARVRLSQPFRTTKSPTFRLALEEFFSNKKQIVEASVGGLMLNVVAVATSLFSMQVYDRVIPTGAISTLQVLSLGVLIAIVFELVVKLVRSRIFLLLLDKTDAKLARSIYLKFLEIRLDQLPSSVGGLAAQIRGYETVRSFLAVVTASITVDAPLIVIYLALIAALAGWLALIPAGFLLLALALGMFYRKRIEALAQSANQASNRKTGLLVEAVEGAETIKSGQGGWRMLSTWMRNTDEARHSDTQMRNLTEHSQHITAFLQQGSYVALVAVGALAITNTTLSMGGLIACTILSGRVLAPVGMIPNLFVQWGHCKAALQGLDALWKLEGDHHGMDQPVVPPALQGAFEFEKVQFSYRQQLALNIPALSIQSGERIGVLGPVGSGKTTLIRMLSGMYKPQSGSVRLDGIDISHISKPALAEHVGYLQQEGRLFAGTLRDNLVLGLVDPGDGPIFEAAAQTGLLDSVIKRHPQGLQQPIFEGGQGLSGGQRQLVNLTRVLLRKPSIWLLDEPTASMDQSLELHVRELLHRKITPSQTLVLVTHKPEMLVLVDRIIVIVNQQIFLDGPKDKVLAALSRTNARPVPAISAPQVTA